MVDRPFKIRSSGDRVGLGFALTLQLSPHTLIAQILQITRVLTGNLFRIWRSSNMCQLPDNQGITFARQGYKTVDMSGYGAARPLQHAPYTGKAMAALAV